MLVNLPFLCILEKSSNVTDCSAENYMTIVISWINKENIACPQLWTVTDSLLSQQISTKTEPLLNCAVKLFPIRVVCAKPNQKGFFSDIYFATTIGMAFAGSSLLAFNLYAFLSYTLGNLANRNDTAPSIENFAEHAYVAFQSLLHHYITVNSKSTPCEISIFGYCSRAREYQLFHITHKGINKKSHCKQVDLSSDDAIHLMGDRTKEIKQSIIEHRSLSANKGSVGWLRHPKSVIENLINKKVFDTIGGEIQLGISEPMGFGLYSLCRPLIPGLPASTFKYQNIDFSLYRSLMNVGDCIVNVKAMV